jgi:hypothetical protein
MFEMTKQGLIYLWKQNIIEAYVLVNMIYKVSCFWVVQLLLYSAITMVIMNVMILSPIVILTIHVTVLDSCSISTEMLLSHILGFLLLSSSVFF